MYYLETKNLIESPRNWHDIINVIEKAIAILANNDFAQPVKPYLRYGDAANRIIAMPAFIGGDIDIAGIKWIASFPKNIELGLKRANSVTILNNAQTGEPECIINSTLISEIRTAAVSGALIKKYISLKNLKTNFTVGIIGFGPIGQIHLNMISDILGEKVQKIYLYDLRDIDKSKIPEYLLSKIEICSSFREAYDNTDIFITATVSDKPYINTKPKTGSLQLNISLRDYHSKFLQYVDVMIVDNWEEVCREKTDIEMMFLNENLKKEDTIDLIDVFANNKLNQLKDDNTVMFNPMGMAIFDMAIGNYYYRQAKNKNIGIQLI